MSVTSVNIQFVSMLYFLELTTEFYLTVGICIK